MCDPKECRDYAAKCAQMANNAHDINVQRSLFDIAGAWTQLAADIERSREAPSRYRIGISDDCAAGDRAAIA